MQSFRFRLRLVDYTNYNKHALSNEHVNDCTNAHDSTSIIDDNLANVNCHTSCSLAGKPLFGSLDNAKRQYG